MAVNRQKQHTFFVGNERRKHTIIAAGGLTFKKRE